MEYTLLNQIGASLYAGTGGACTLELLSAGVLGSQARTLQMTADGSLPLCLIESTVLAEQFPDFSLLSAPFLFDSPEHQESVFRSDALLPLFLETETGGLTILCAWSPGPQGICTREAPISSPASLRELRVQTGSSDTSVSFFERAGSVSAGLPARDVYSSFSLGILDGAEENLFSYTAGLHYEVAPFYTFTNHLYSTELLVIGTETLSALEDREAAVLKDACTASVPLGFRLFEERRAACRQEAEIGNAVFFDVDNADFRNLSADITAGLASQSEVTQAVFDAIAALRPPVDS